VIYDMVHPADAHFFRHLIDHQRLRGDAVLVTSRYKDITVTLLERLGIPHRPISSRGRGALGLLAELGLRDLRLLGAARGFSPDLVVANNSPSAAHVGRWLGVPSVIFDDTEIHRPSRALSLPLVTEVHSPDCFRLDLGRKHVRYPSYHALAYLHPAHFTPKPEVLRRRGVEPVRKRVLVRFVDDKASHDLGVFGLNRSNRRHLILSLAAWAEVMVSAETPLDDDLAIYRCPLEVHEMHQLIAHSDLLVADSATMSAEAAVLGTPAIYLDGRGRGYTDELDARYGLCFRFATDRLQEALGKAMEILARHDPRAEFRDARARLLRDKVDPLPHQIDTIDRLARSHSRCIR
jgi:predicted glycosyltransferase